MRPTRLATEIVKAPTIVSASRTCVQQLVGTTKRVLERAGHHGYGIRASHLGRMTPRLVCAYRWCTAFGIASLAAILPRAEGQQLPTDNDLRAAYCLAYQEDALRLGTTALADLEKDASTKSGVPKSTVDEFRADVRQQEQRVARLRSYVLPRLNYLEPLAMTVALRRGKEDAQRFGNEWMKCINDCLSSTDLKRAVDVCTKRCSQGEQFDRIQSCRNLSWLPF